MTRRAFGAGYRRHIDENRRERELGTREVVDERGLLRVGSQIAQWLYFDVDSTNTNGTEITLAHDLGRVPRAIIPGCFGTFPDSGSGLRYTVADEREWNEKTIKLRYENQTASAMRFRLLVF